MLTMKARPPSEEDFVDLFQKIKYSLCLLDRLKSSIYQPDAPELLHHIFLPLGLIVKTTGGPALGASVVSPAMTSGAVSLLQEHLTDEEKTLWTSLGTNWTSPCSNFSASVPPYSPVFSDGWQPQAYDSAGQLLEDPIQLQHKHDAFREGRQAQTGQEQAGSTAEGHGEGPDEGDNSGHPPEGERLYCCSYDFVARNSSELSVLHGETLEVIESSKRWWKCQNRFDEIGFVPSNILEPLSALNGTERNNSVVRTESKKVALTPRCFSYLSSSPDGMSPTAISTTLRPQSLILPSTASSGEMADRLAMRPYSMLASPAGMSGENSDRVLIMNDELLQKLAAKKDSIRQPGVPQSPDTFAPLNYHSPSAEVEAWLTAKGFSQQTIQSLGILTGAQLFSLNKDELCTVSPEEGARVYSQITVQRAFLEDVHKSSELEAAMEKQKLKIDLNEEIDM
ncbi:epidermal growth factor receptor kinase substrate 8-like protein 1a isoform X2 [Cololabis saira]|nr:epidermal growth factor receptor kinase substrate 8-like protein 1a isoform X2 [Cololabis saira]